MSVFLSGFFPLFHFISPSLLPVIPFGPHFGESIGGQFARCGALNNQSEVVCINTTCQQPPSFKPVFHHLMRKRENLTDLLRLQPYSYTIPSSLIEGCLLLKYDVAEPLRATTSSYSGGILNCSHASWETYFFQHVPGLPQGLLAWNPSPGRRSADIQSDARATSSSSSQFKLFYFIHEPRTVQRLYINGIKLTSTSIYLISLSHIYYLWLCVLSSSKPVPACQMHPPVCLSLVACMFRNEHLPMFGERKYMWISLVPPHPNTE